MKELPASSNLTFSSYYHNTNVAKKFRIRPGCMDGIGCKDGIEMFAVLQGFESGFGRCLEENIISPRLMNNCSCFFEQRT